jgi:hypothetical protein
MMLIVASIDSTMTIGVNLYRVMLISGTIVQTQPVAEKLAVLQNSRHLIIDLKIDQKTNHLPNIIDCAEHCPDASHSCRTKYVLK